MPKKTTGKENSNLNLQNTLSKTATVVLGTRHNAISSNALIQAAKNNRMYRERVSHNLVSLHVDLYLGPHIVYKDLLAGSIMKICTVT
jgi:hypothetical protein